jgi:hypothetical protein
MSPEYGSTSRSSRSTTRRSTTCASPAATSADRARRGLRQGAGPVARPERPSPCTPSTARARPGTVVPSIAGPKRPQDRIELSEAKAAFAESLPTYTVRRPGKRRRSPGRRSLRAGQRRRRHRRDHLVHQHVEPVGDDRRRPGREEGRREGPDPQAVGEDLWRPAPRSSPTTTRRPACGRTSTSSASTLVGYGCTTCIGNSGPLPRGLARRSTTTTWPSPRCSRATATSRAASAPT